MIYCQAKGKLIPNHHNSSPLFFGQQETGCPNGVWNWECQFQTAQEGRRGNRFDRWSFTGLKRDDERCGKWWQMMCDMMRRDEMLLKGCDEGRPDRIRWGMMTWDTLRWDMLFHDETWWEMIGWDALKRDMMSGDGKRYDEKRDETRSYRKWIGDKIDKMGWDDTNIGEDWKKMIRCNEKPVEIMRNRACAELDPQSSFAKAKTQLQQSTRIYRMMIDSIDQWIWWPIRIENTWATCSRICLVFSWMFYFPRTGFLGLVFPSSQPST